MNYCSYCAAPVSSEIPPDDNRTRYVCTSCRRIHYQNPKMVVGCIPVWDDKILLCNRNIEPRKGYWTLPAGYLECNESTEEGAVRETLEETGALVVKLQPYRLFDIVHIDQIYFMFLASLRNTNFHATEESIEVRLFKEKDIPWSAIAFPVIETILQHYFKSRRENDFSFHHEQLTEKIKQN